MAFGLSKIQKVASGVAKKVREAGKSGKIKKLDLTPKERKARAVANRNARLKAQRAEAAKVKKGKAIAKRKAIAKNVAAKKKRDAAGMARAKKLASQGQATAAKKKPKAPKAAAAGGGKKAGGAPKYSAMNINSYKEAIMIKEGLNTWPSTRDPFPKSRAEWTVWNKVT